MPIILPILGWSAAGVGMGMVYATASMLALAWSSKEEQDANSTALQLGESLAVSTTLAVGGCLFALLLKRDYIWH